MGAVQPLHIVLVEHRRHWLDLFESRPQLGQHFLVQHRGMHRSLIHVVLENVPAGKHNVLQVRQRNKVLDQRAIVIRALAQPNGAHLGQRAHRLRQTLPHRFNACNHRCSNGAQAHHHHTQLALGRLNLTRRPLALAHCLLLRSHLLLLFSVWSRGRLPLDRLLFRNTPQTVSTPRCPAVSCSGGSGQTTQLPKAMPVPPRDETDETTHGSADQCATPRPASCLHMPAQSTTATSR